MSNPGRATLVVFGEDFSISLLKSQTAVETIVAKDVLKEKIQNLGLKFVPLDSLIDPGSIYEATSLFEQLSFLKSDSGQRLPKIFAFKGYELWWMYSNSLFLYFCLPFTQYRRLLEYVSDFDQISFIRPPFKSLFFYYLRAHHKKVSVVGDSRLKIAHLIPFGIFLQLFITLISLPIIIIKRVKILVFIGDKFDKDQDYDFRMKFIYQELRQREIPFVEFIRSLEPWRKVLNHAWVRRRPMIYSEAIFFFARILSRIFGGLSWSRANLGINLLPLKADSIARFKFLIATHYLSSVYNDIWAIRIMKLITKIIGIKKAFFTAALERNLHAVLGCKLNRIPTVGILHGVSSRFYNQYDFLPTFNGEKVLSVDKYGLWSDWWKEYYLKNSKIYRPEQLFVSGLMRPLEKKVDNFVKKSVSQSGAPIKVLFVSEQLAIPEEVTPYLEELLKSDFVQFIMKFRPYRDGFEEWLKKNRPGLLEKNNIEILRGQMPEAIRKCDVVVGSHSTAVLESVLQAKPFVFFKTKKWGDYYELAEFEGGRYLAVDSKDLVNKIKKEAKPDLESISSLQNRYFGDPYKNGSKWVIDQLS